MSGQWIQDMADAVDVAEQQQAQREAQREQQDEVAAQPVTTPRNLDPQVQVVFPTPPPPQAHRPEYDSQREQRWSHPPTYYLDYGSTRTGADYHQEMERFNMPTSKQPLDWKISGKAS